MGTCLCYIYARRYFFKHYNQKHIHLFIYLFYLVVINNGDDLLFHEVVDILYERAAAQAHFDFRIIFNTVM